MKRRGSQVAVKMRGKTERKAAVPVLSEPRLQPVEMLKLTL
jgi:hypothetical protein